MEFEKVKGLIEGILFVSGEPVDLDELSKALGLSEADLLFCVKEMAKDYTASNRGIMISIVGQKVRLTTKPQIFKYIKKIFKPKIKEQLSSAALETLAIIMFKQPITKAEIESIRGVNVDRMVKNLQEKNLICELGHAELPGKPILYGITQQCMEYFGIRSLDDIADLDNLDDETQCKITDLKSLDDDIAN